ncbi:MAG: hydrogenase maturation protease [Bacteroidales bacterium]|nr:hydrogenase maturation protease [Bacteroidales bacterium]
MTKFKRVLIYGYGNPGRQDDGLGAAFIQKMEEWISKNPCTGINLDCNYQLNIEDAEVISGMDLVVFVDASQEVIEDFSFTRVDASSARVEFSMHAVSPAFVVDLCKKMFHDAPVTYLLHIKGSQWDFKEELSKTAVENLEKAFTFLTNKILKGELLALESN